MVQSSVEVIFSFAEVFLLSRILAFIANIAKCVLILKNSNCNQVVVFPDHALGREVTLLIS